MTLPQGTVTFLFTDVEGSTRQLERAPREFEAGRAASRQAIRAACHEGFEVDTQGDAFFFAFARAEDAVAAAEAAQEGLFRLALPPDAGFARSIDQTLSFELGPEYPDLLAEGAALPTADAIRLALADEPQRISIASPKL